HPPGRLLCASLAPPGSDQAHNERNRTGMARVCTAVYSFAPSFVAEQRMDQEESMVRGRALVLFAAARAACVIALIGFAACAPTVAPGGAELGTPVIDKDAFIARDGMRLPLRHWEAEDPRAVLVALHGMSDYSEAFDLPGPWWAAHGIATYAYDQRGFGRSPDRGVWAGSETMRQDL